MKFDEDKSINSLIDSAMEKIKGIVDSSTIIGDAIITDSGKTIIPISKVAVGFFSGGGEYNDLNAKRNSADFPMAGGTGGGFSVSPIGFFVLKEGKFKIVHADKSSAYLTLLKSASDVLKKFAENKE